MEPARLVDCRCEIGENPLWHPMEKRVYWVDIPAGRIFRHDPAGGQTETFDAGAAVGGFTIQEDGALLLFMARGAVRLWREGAMQTVIEDIPDERNNRFNDVIADPAGRVFCGTVTAPDHPGRLYRLDLDGTITQLLDDIGTSNGLGFSPDRTKLYYTDSRAHEIYVFDYDADTGAIANRRVLVKVPEDGGSPDGLTVDAEGTIWGARWGGSRLVRHAPDGSEMQRIAFPASRVSSVIFGGPDLTDLYVTTAGGNDRGQFGPGAGALFHLNPGIRGLPEFYSKIRV